MSKVKEPIAAFQIASGNDLASLVNAARRGISYNAFVDIVEKSRLTIQDWASFLHLSERTLQRYKKENKAFASPHSDTILEITLLQNKGIEVLGNRENYHKWLETPNIALGGQAPKNLLDSSFGIEMVKQTLSRIEHGIFS